MFFCSSVRLPKLQVFCGAAALFLCYLILPQSEPPPRSCFPNPKTPIVPRGTHNLFIFKYLLYVFLLFRKASETSSFLWGGGSFSRYLTFPQSEPPPRPCFPNPKTPIVPRGTHNLFIFKCLLCVFLLFRKTSETSSFLWGGGSFSRYLTFPQFEPPPRPCFPNPKTLIVPRGTHNLFIFKCLLYVFLLFRKASETSSFLWGGGSFSLLLNFSPIRTATPNFQI